MTFVPKFSIEADVWPGVAKLVEECGEVTQVVGKLMATGGEVEHWDGTNLRDRLQEEIADLQAAITFVVDLNQLDRATIAARVVDKRATFGVWRVGARNTSTVK